VPEPRRDRAYATVDVCYLAAFATATHAVPVLRGAATRPLFVTAAGLPVPEAVSLVRTMTGRYRVPDALRRADALARSAATKLA
jgi:endonuclease V-like protein UPF0215 family